MNKNNMTLYTFEIHENNNGRMYVHAKYVVAFSWEDAMSKADEYTSRFYEGATRIPFSNRYELAGQGITWNHFNMEIAGEVQIETINKTPRYDVFYTPTFELMWTPETLEDLWPTD